MTLSISKEQGTFYQPEKYPIIEGEQSPLALCTCWSDTETLIKMHPEIKMHISITGTLYSQEGISILLRNLLLNPSIQYVFVWRKSPLSNTEMGRKAWQALFQLWKEGITEEHIVTGTTISIHKEIDLTCIRELIEKVKLIDIDKQDISELISAIKQHQFSFQEENERKKYSFPEPIRDTSKELPSEEVGFLARENSLFLTWLRVVDFILSYGKIKKTEYGSRQKELQHITWVIEEHEQPFFPKLPRNIEEIIGLDAKALENYSACFLSPEKKEGVAYTYGERLRDYHNIDQIAKMIEKLKKNATTRRAIAITFDPEKDYESSSPPCLNHVQVMVDTKVNLFATFRSHDIFKAGISNTFGLLALQDYIAKALSLEKGVLSITSHSAHIYEEEWKDAKDLVMCQLRERISTRFKEHRDLDPRGIVKIQVLNNAIQATLLSYEGEELFTFVGKTCRELIMKFAKLHLLSRADHYCDITIELMKAEIALNMHIPYQQDKPLETPLFSIK
ncbi:thymidylate synthase [Candidatus Woesearchaeota archaeon]|nr:thymidylate synthase [Candidatus Woesearchaeota archaeon]